MTEGVTLAAAFGGGLISFLSPCVIPLAPVYLATLCGPQIYDESRSLRVPMFLHSLVFICGFSLVFILLGAIAGLTSYAFNPSVVVLNRVAGSLLIAFGVFMLAALKVPRLNFEKRLTPSVGSTTSYGRSFIIGASFSLGWVACVSPILGGILALASAQGTAWQGAYLLAVYSLGLGLPFLIIGLAFDTLRPWLRSISRYSRLIYIIGGVLLIAVGILVLTGNIAKISGLAG
ncbi:cytochrome c biogenesis CcdA family protein [Chloroflexota bacterium]